MRNLTKKISAAMVATSLMVGAVAYPTKNANAGVGLAVVGALASNGSGAILLPAGVAIASMFGGLGLFIFGCYAFLPDMEPGDVKGAAKAFGVLFLDKGTSNSNLQTDIRTKLLANYRNENLNENDADLLAQIIVTKVQNTKLADNSTTEVLFSDSEIAQVVDSIAESNPTLAVKISDDFTKTSMK
jgi:hypothetical protein